jgi:hypothetical protein
MRSRRAGVAPDYHWLLPPLLADVGLAERTRLI